LQLKTILYSLAGAVLHFLIILLIVALLKERVYTSIKSTNNNVE